MRLQWLGQGLATSSFCAKAQADLVKSCWQAVDEFAGAMLLIAACARIMCAASVLATQNEPKSNIDTIVLGCTHYPFAAQHLAAQLGLDVQLLDTGDAVARQTRQRLGHAVSAQLSTQPIEFITTGHPATLRAAARAWLGLNADIKTLHI